MSRTQVCNHEVSHMIASFGGAVKSTARSHQKLKILTREPDALSPVAVRLSDHVLTTARSRTRL
jgi:hypothetical protein